MFLLKEHWKKIWCIPLDSEPKRLKIPYPLIISSNCYFSIKKMVEISQNSDWNKDVCKVVSDAETANVFWGKF